jgi:hypothetical protein
VSKNIKKNNKMIYYAKILIAISIAILVYGFILDINNNVRLIDPEKNVKVINNDNGNYTSIDTNNDEITRNNDDPPINSNISESQPHVVENSDVNNNGNNILRDKIEKKI